MFGSTSLPPPFYLPSRKAAPPPAFRSTCHAIFSSRDEFAARGDLPGETRYSQFRPTTVAGIEGAGGKRPLALFFFPADLPISPDRTACSLRPLSRQNRPVSRFKPNFFCFSSRRARSTREWHQVAGKLARNRRTARENDYSTET